MVIVKTEAAHRPKGRPRGRPAASTEPAGRERLLAAALTLFSQQGYAATTISQIIAAAGVTSPVLYHHFGDKADLFVTVATELHERVQDRIRSAAETNQTIADALANFIRTTSVSHPSEPYYAPMMLVVALEGSRNPDLSYALVPILKSFRALFEDMVRRERPNLSNARTRELTNAIIGIVNGFAVVAATLTRPSDLAHIADWMIYLIGAGDEPGKAALASDEAPAPARRSPKRTPRSAAG